MASIITTSELNNLTEADILGIHQSGDPLIYFFEEVENELKDYIANNAVKWLDGSKNKALDARRLLENAEWQAPMLTTDVLPKALLLSPSLWDLSDFVNQLNRMGLQEFYSWPAVHLSYEEAFSLVFNFSDYFHGGMVSVTDHCNLRCRGCAYHGSDQNYQFSKSRKARARQDIDDDAFKLYLDQLPEGKDILFCGSGELFVSKKAMPYVREAVERGLYVRILTNGMLVDNEVAEELVDLKVGAVIFSIDGHTKEIVEKIRIGIDFDLVLDNLRNLINVRDKKQSSMTIGVQCGWFDEVIPHKDEIVEYWKDFGVDILNFFAEKTDWYITKTISNSCKLPPNNMPCFNALITPVLLTNGLVAPCTGNFQAEWGDNNMDWLRSIRDASLTDIVKYYRRMRLDPKSPYRQKCAICSGKYASYTNRDYENNFALAYRFTDRNTIGEAAFVKLVPRSASDNSTDGFLKKIAGFFRKT